jgi:TPR repeat protein
MRTAAAVALLALLTASPALAKKNKVANPPPGIQLPLQAAASGDPTAQFEMGVAYLSGKGVKRNPADGVAWLSTAAGNGSAAAAVELARAFETGNGVGKDPGQASQWWYRAADLGDEAARNRFIELYLAGQTDGIGGPAAIGWLETRANAGDARIARKLGELFELGQGVLVDHAKARHWYRQAAVAGDVDAKFRLGRMLLGEPAQWRLVFVDPEKEKDNADRDRLYPTRDAALKAGGTERRPDMMRPGMIEGEEWLTEAAEQGSAEARYVLGMAHLEGRDLPADIPLAVEYLSGAAWLGHAGAALVLADMASKGYGFPSPDPVRAWVSFDLAAADGVASAEAARNALAKSMNQKQLARARQIAQDLKNN